MEVAFVHPAARSFPAVYEVVLLDPERFPERVDEAGVPRCPPRLRLLPVAVRVLPVEPLFDSLDLPLVSASPSSLSLSLVRSIWR